MVAYTRKGIYDVLVEDCAMNGVGWLPNATFVSSKDPRELSLRAPPLRSGNAIPTAVNVCGARKFIHFLLYMAGRRIPV